MATSIDLVDRVRALEVRINELEGLLRTRKRPGVSWSKHVSGWLDIETRLGLTWFNRLGAVALVAALAFAAAWANDQGYLSPAVRTILASSVAAALLALACFKLRSVRGARRAFFTGVALIGAGGLLVAPATAALVDGMITTHTAIAILIAVVAATLALAALLDVFALALVATVGGALVPLVSRDGDPQFLLVTIYLSALGVAAIAAQIHRRWTGLDAIAIGSLSIYSLAWSGFDASAASTICGAGIWAAAIAYEAWRRSAICRRTAESHRTRALIAAAIAGGVALLASGVAWPAVILVAGHVWVWRDPKRPRQLFGLLALCVAGCIVFPSALAGAILLPFLWQAIRHDDPLLAGLAVIITAGVWAYVGIELAQSGLASVAVAAYAVTCVFIGIDERKRCQPLAATLIAAGGVCAVVAAWPLAIALAPAKLSLAITVAATAVGLLLVAIGMLTGLKLVRAVGLSAVALVAAKLVVVDVWSLSSGTRVIALCALGLGFFGVSFLYSRVVSSRDGETANC